MTRPVYVTRAGIAGTILVFVLTIIFVRLGFWQLDRLEQRRERNAAVAERLAQPPLELEAVPPDTAGLLYRRLRLEGVLDGTRSIVWAGHSHGGRPGVYLLTPLRLEGGGGAVLVNRGFVPAADAATIDARAYAGTERVVLEAVALPLPDQPGADPEAAVAGGRTWFRVDPDLLRGRLPYPVAGFYAQALPTEEAGREPPVRLPPPALDEGSHLSYAIQWFGFAAIALIGWAALALRGRAPRAGAAE